MVKKNDHRTVQSLDAAIRMFMDEMESEIDRGERSPKTSEYYRYSLLPLTRFLDQHYPEIRVEQITDGIIREAVAWQLARTSPHTANHMLNAVKRLFGFLVEHGYLDANPAGGIERQELPEKVDFPNLSPEQVNQLLSVVRGKAFLDIRDRAIILLMLDTGIRASELCNLERSDIDMRLRTVRIADGWGLSERRISFGDEAAHAVLRYLERIDSAGVDSDSLFVTRDANPLNRDRLKDLVVRRGQQAGIQGVQCTPETLRHTCALDMLRNGGDTFALQHRLGHVSQDMIRRYWSAIASDKPKGKDKFHPLSDRVVTHKKQTPRKKRLG